MLPGNLTMTRKLPGPRNSLKRYGETYHLGMFLKRMVSILFSGFSIIFTIHFGGFTPIFGSTPIWEKRMLGGGNSNIFGIFIPKLGEDEPNLTNIFFGWVGSTTNQYGKLAI